MGEISVRPLGNMNQTEGHETELRLPQGYLAGEIYCQFQLTQNRLVMAGVRSQYRSSRNSPGYAVVVKLSSHVSAVRSFPKL